MIEKKVYGNTKTILIGQDSYYIALPVRLSGTANSTLLAGQPLSGDITARDTAFTKPAASGEDANKAAGVLLHDVVLDANGKGNGTLVLAACVDLLKLDSSIVTAISSAKGLDRIIFVKGSAI